ncbi:trypsin-like serine peptidase [Mycobacterium sp.]|uniref:trypsin-like serine peptidase n=1 Tax=Mycobacterium sp. TaxID=1785 RepID=UPI003D6BEC59
MRIVAAAKGLPIGLAVLLAACGGQADSAPGTSTPERPVADSTSRVVARPVSPDPEVGAIFLGDGDLHTCTGAVVHSVGGDLMLTAAHCLPGGIRAGFVPGLSGAAALTDTWTVDTVYLDPRWVDNRDPHADYAIARVSRAAGGSIEAQVGSALSLGTAPAPGTPVSVIAYPMGVAGGPIGCRVATGITDGYPTLPCAGLADGTSGAPWIDGPTVIGVIGGFEAGGCQQRVSYSAPFDEHTAALLARAEAGGPGDAAPPGFEDPC